MKDLYHRLGIPRESSEHEIGIAIASGTAIDAATRTAAEFILLDPRRRDVFDRSHHVLTNIGQLRSRLGLSRKPFWSSGRYKDFTPDVVPAVAPRRNFRLVRPLDMARAFGLSARQRRSSYDFDREDRKRILITALVLLVAAAISAALIIYLVPR